MANFRALPVEMNGFKILEDLGRAENKIRYARVICKHCENEFVTSVYHIEKINSCGCLPARAASVLATEINGFKILKDYGYSNGCRRALAVCKVCDKEYEVDPNKLKYRKHCGCIKAGTKVSQYAKTNKPILLTYRHMKARCYRETSQDYYNYGARGIKICDEWLENPDSFVEWAISNGWKKGLSIDRIDSLKGYSPDNCRWATPIMQGRNTRRVVLDIEKVRRIRSEINMSKGEIAKKYGVSPATVWLVINNRIWKE